MDIYEVKCRNENQQAYEKALEKAQPIGKLSKYLLAHEKELLDSGQIFNITHHGSSSAWLQAPLRTDIDNEHTNVYRPMGDVEVQYLVKNKLLPTTQPYQAIIEGAVGFAYSCKYLNGKKYTDTEPSTVVEFTCPKTLIDKLKTIQMKVEDGALSMGLGNKAGGGIDLFNSHLEDGTSTFRIVKIKRVTPSNKK